MTMSSGTRLGPYEIVAPLGAGGMGEVYKARDTRLDRSVAVKILPAELADNAQLRARFEREAKSISQLNHPHICTLHDVGDNFLVMELIDGETLAERTARGPLPIEQVLRYGAEIAHALDAAHRHGIVHRDLKPGNVMITKSGAKVLDFGLARSGTEGAIDVGGETVQKSLTSEGTILGTFQYMAPEQLEGERVDHRADIFALGAVLYEMATGRRAFEGKTKTSLIAAIVAAEPKPMHELQPLAPEELEHVVAKCLAKDPDERWQSAQDIAAELEWIATRAGRAAKPKRAAKPWMIASAILAVALAAALAFALLGRRRADVPLMTLSLAMPPRMFDYYAHSAFSPDGSSLAFTGSTKGGTSLWVRRLDERTPRALPGTEGAVQPFWSPDGKAIGFFADGKLKRIFVAGGPPQVICDAVYPTGGTWNRDGVIVFGAGMIGPLMRVGAGGGQPRPLMKLGPAEEAHRWPWFLPDGDHFVFLGDAPKTEDHHLRLGSLKENSSAILTQAVSSVAYAEPDSILFVRGGSLLAQTLDMGRKALTGEPRVLAENVVASWQNHRFEFAAAPNGRLVYRSASPLEQLTWVDRNGKVLSTIGAPRRFQSVRLSPDGKRMAYGERDADGRGADIWVLDLARGVPTRVTFDPTSDTDPVWSPDGTRIAFQGLRQFVPATYITDVSNPSNIQQLPPGKSDVSFYPESWPNADTLFLAGGDPKTIDIWIYSPKTRQMRPHIATPFDEYEAALSPDGTLLAYVSEESGHPEVYVERFPSRAERRQVSSGFGYRPAWRSDGRELIYFTQTDVMSVDPSSDGATPQVLFRETSDVAVPSADGQRFLVARPVDDVTTIPLTFVSDWRR